MATVRINLNNWLHILPYCRILCATYKELRVSSEKFKGIN